MLYENTITNDIGYNFYIRTHKQPKEVSLKPWNTSTRLLTKTVKVGSSLKLVQ